MGKSTCKTCGKKFPTEERYIGLKYKQLKFCSEECYNSYAKASGGDPTRRELLDYLNSIYEKPNFELLTAQIERLRKEQNVSYKALYLIIDYAIKYEDHMVLQSVGIGQFYPRYYRPALEFYQQVQRNRKYAEEHPDLLTPEVIRVEPKNSMRKFVPKEKTEF